MSAFANFDSSISTIGRLLGEQGLAGEGWGEGVEKGRSGVEWGWMLHTSLSAKEVCDHTVTEG